MYNLGCCCTHGNWLFSYILIAPHLFTLMAVIPSFTHMHTLSILEYYVYCPPLGSHFAHVTLVFALILYILSPSQIYLACSSAYCSNITHGSTAAGGGDFLRRTNTGSNEQYMSAETVDRAIRCVRRYKIMGGRATTCTLSEVSLDDA